MLRVVTMVTNKEVSHGGGWLFRQNNEIFKGKHNFITRVHSLSEHVILESDQKGINNRFNHIKLVKTTF
jgi:hypothetical protein